MSRAVVVVGAGGNIGSHLVPHLGRMDGIDRVTLIDRDVYEAANLASQDVTRRDLGQPKAMVQARRLCRVAPAMRVIAIAEAVEHVPLGLLRADVLVACLDSRAARRIVNACAWRLGMPWIDAGVRRDDLLARVNVYTPGEDQPCYECAFDDPEEFASEQAYPCATDDHPAATAAPSALGALAASLQALECGKLLAGDTESVAVARQVTISARAHQHHVTRFTRNPDCRFDHGVWEIAPRDLAPETTTLRAAFGGDAAMRLRVANQTFVTGLVCPTCGARRDLTLRLLGRLGTALRACPACGGAMRPTGGDVVEWLTVADLPPGLGDASLARIDVRGGDVLTFAGVRGTTHVQLGGVP